MIAVHNFWVVFGKGAVCAIRFDIRLMIVIIAAQAWEKKGT